MTTSNKLEELYEPCGPIPAAMEIMEDYIRLIGVSSGIKRQQLDNKCSREIFTHHPTNIFTKEEFISFLMDRMRMNVLIVNGVAGEVTEDDKKFSMRITSAFFRNYFTNEEMELMVESSKGGMTPESYRNLWSGMVEQNNFTFKEQN